MSGVGWGGRGCSSTGSSRSATALDEWKRDEHNEQHGGELFHWIFPSIVTLAFTAHAARRAENTSQCLAHRAHAYPLVLCRNHHAEPLHGAPLTTSSAESKETE